jgi:hypothetical protein
MSILEEAMRPTPSGRMKHSDYPPKICPKCGKLSKVLEQYYSDSSWIGLFSSCCKVQVGVT